MLKEIMTYPTTPSLEFGANIRHFDASLFVKNVSGYQY